MWEEKEESSIKQEEKKNGFDHCASEIRKQEMCHTQNAQTYSQWQEKKDIDDKTQKTQKKWSDNNQIS